MAVMAIVAMHIHLNLDAARYDSLLTILNFIYQDLNCNSKVHDRYLNLMNSDSINIIRDEYVQLGIDMVN